MLENIQKHTIITSLHERGFSQDFELTNEGVRWVQQQVLIPGFDCSVFEYHRIPPPNGKGQETIVLGILSVSRSVKGILIHHGMPIQFGGPGINHTIVKATCTLQSNQHLHLWLE